MQININNHQLDVTNVSHDYADERLSHLERYSDKITDAQMTIEIERLKREIEATPRIAGGEIVADTEHEDVYAAIGLLIDELNRQLAKRREEYLK